jgi:hypothetical protein
MATVEVEEVTVAQELERIRLSHSGFLKPEDVVEEARDKNSVLHSNFEWSNSKAASMYRLEQARRLIRVCIKVISNDKPAVRTYVSLRMDRVSEDGGTAGYREIVSVMSKQDLREQLLQDAFADFEFFRKKYQYLVELAPLFDVFERLRRPVA